MGSNPRNVTGKKRTVLVVDDEKIVRMMIDKMLKLENFNVILTENGAEAVEVFDKKKDEIDLVLLDMIMPIMGGRECYFELKKRKEDVRVVLVSGFLHKEDLIELESNGICGYLRKPFHIDDLIELVNKSLE